MPFEVKSAIALTELELREIVDDLEIDDKLLDSHLSCFLLSTQGDSEAELSASYVRKDHMLKNLANREYVQVQFENFIHLNVHSIEHASNAKAQVSEKLIQFIEDRFRNFDEPVFAT